MEKAQIKKLDTIFSNKYSGSGLCDWCGKWHVLHNHHINYRRYLATRWLRMNIMRLCVKCHAKAHDKRIQFQEFALSKLGRKKYFELEQLARDTFKPQKSYEEIVINI